MIKCISFFVSGSNCIESILFLNSVPAPSRTELLLILVILLLLIVSVILLVVAIYTFYVFRKLQLYKRVQKVSAGLYFLPSWKTAIYASIIIAGIFFLGFYVFNFSLLSPEKTDFNTYGIDTSNEVHLSEHVTIIDENTVEFTDNPDIHANGRIIYKTQCAVCHAPDGGGGLGPNFTDEYWIHGGSIKNIFWVIKYGVPEKGMISWQSHLTPEIMRDVACYIYNLRGTIPVNPKEPEGVFYDENVLVKNLASPDRGLAKPTIKSVIDSLDDVQIGRGLFSGSIMLINGGPGCIICHNVTDDILPKGALIAPDLSSIYTKFDEKSIISIVTKPYHTLMQEAYIRNPVTIEEAKSLMPFFKFAGTETAYQQKRNERAAGFLNRIKK